MPAIAVRQHFTISAALLVAAIAGPSLADAAGSSPENSAGLEHCLIIRDDAARLRCFEDATSPPAKKIPSTSNGWQLLRTPRPQGAGEAVSMTHTPELMRSDPDFAGMMLRCGDKGIEILFVVISPFSPRSHPMVTVPGADNDLRFAATVVPPGVALRLPDDALALADGPWQSRSELPVKIEDSPISIRGIVPISGLDVALKTLRANCQSP